MKLPTILSLVLIAAIFVVIAASAAALLDWLFEVADGIHNERIREGLKRLIKTLRNIIL